MSATHEEGLTYRRVLASLLVITWVFALLVAIGPGGAVQAICGLLLVLILPGTLVTYALLPPSREVPGPLRAMLSFALSLVTALAVGLLLALCFDEVSRGAAALALAVVGTLAGLLAGRRVDESQGTAIATALPVPAPVAVVTGVLLVACVAIGVAALNVSNLPGHFTALTVSPSAVGARVEVRSHEGQASSYRYVIRDQDDHSLRSGTIELDGGETRTFDLAVPISTDAISVALYTKEGAQPYRLVTLHGLH